jgi:cytochrome P450
MALVSELDLPVLDYTDPALRGRAFHPRMAELRAQGWLAATPIGVMVLEREAAEVFLRSRSTTFPGRKLAELFGIETGPLAEELRRNILCIDGDDHRRLRNLVNPAFTPRAADRWRPAMRTYLEQLWDAVRADGRCEFVDAFAKPYPSLVIATVMGAPLKDAPRLHHWSNWIQKQFDAEALMTQRELIEEAVVEFYEYADALLAARRDDPGDDLVSTLLAAEADGDRLSDVECVNLVLNVLIGGVDTTQSQLGHAVRLFAEHPEQWDALRSDPVALAPGAVDEALRYEPITPFTARIVTEDMQLRDVAFPAGTVVLVAACTANRDGVGESDRFDITRTDGGRVTTFGAGIHYCLGANLARAELQEGLAFLASRIDRLELDGEPVYGGVTGIYGLDTLPIRFTAA